jgi:hypothetical protein
MQMTVQLGLFATMLLLQTVLAWRLVATQRALERVQTRLANQGEALSLLTDTSENGFGAIARELDRLATPQLKSSRRPSTQRVATAVRKGRSVTDIAASERVSEGEVRLRLSMAGQRQPETAADRG